MILSRTRQALASTALAVALFAGGPLLAQSNRPTTEADLKVHVDTLASDAFEGRLPGTAGEMRTIAYIASQWAAAGLVPVPGSMTPFLQRVPLAQMSPVETKLRFKRAGFALTLADERYVILPLSAGAVSFADQATYYAGTGVGADGKASALVKGAVVLVDVEAQGAPAFFARRQALLDAGASAVIGITDSVAPAPRSGRMRRATANSSTAAPTGSIALIEQVVVDTLLPDGATHASLRSRAAALGAEPMRLPVETTLTARFEDRRFDSHNVLAKLPGRKPGSGALVVMGHWDHLGICRPEGAPDRICNGAVDNASGISMMIELARKLKGAKLDRDVYFLATTAEEQGLLGAYHFADDPVVPLDDIVVALNLDTTAIAPKGTPVATIGRGRTEYDKAVRAVATRLGRRIDTDGEGDAFVQRQDGWAFGAKDVPSLMVGGSFSDMPLLMKYIATGDYHKPSDQPGAPYRLDGAAEDTDLHVALVKHFASERTWKRGTSKAFAPGSAADRSAEAR